MRNYYHYRLHIPEDYDKVKELDKTCPKCKTSEHVLLQSSEAFRTKFITKDYSVFNNPDRVRVIQDTYICPVCSTSWKGLIYTEDITPGHSTYIVFPQSAKIRLDTFKQIKNLLLVAIAVVAVIAFFAYLCLLP